MLNMGFVDDVEKILTKVDAAAVQVGWDVLGWVVRGLLSWGGLFEA